MGTGHIAPRWTEHEDDFLKKNWMRMTDAMIGARLDRTADSVANRRNRLGLLRSNLPRKSNNVKREIKIHVRNDEEMPAVFPCKVKKYPLPVVESILRHDFGDKLCEKKNLVKK